MEEEVIIKVTEEDLSPVLLKKIADYRNRQIKVTLKWPTSYSYGSFGDSYLDRYPQNNILLCKKNLDDSISLDISETDMKTSQLIEKSTQSHDNDQLVVDDSLVKQFRKELHH